MAKKSIIIREQRRKYDVRVRNRCKICGRPAGTSAASSSAVFVSGTRRSVATFPES